MKNILKSTLALSIVALSVLLLSSDSDATSANGSWSEWSALKDGQSNQIMLRYARKNDKTMQLELRNDYQKGMRVNLVAATTWEWAGYDVDYVLDKVDLPAGQTQQVDIKGSRINSIRVKSVKQIESPAAM